MPDPLVTVVIPCHNHRQWINDAIDSVVHQDYPRKRIVVVDDGSTDDSVAAVFRRLYRPKGPAQQGDPWAAQGKLLNRDIEVTLFHFAQPHGPSFARNWGIQSAWEDTDIFAFLDSDDLYEPGKISKSVARMDSNVGAVYSDFDTLRPDGLRLRQWKEPFSRQRLLQECIVNCDSLVSKKAIEAVGPFDPELRVCEDYDLWLRVSERFIIEHIPESLVTVRVGTHSSTSTVKKEVWEAAWRKVMAKAQARMTNA